MIHQGRTKESRKKLFNNVTQNVKNASFTAGKVMEVLFWNTEFMEETLSECTQSLLCWIFEARWKK